MHAEQTDLKNHNMQLTYFRLGQADNCWQVTRNGSRLEVHFSE